MILVQYVLGSAQARQMEFGQNEGVHSELDLPSSSHGDTAAVPTISRPGTQSAYGHASYMAKRSDRGLQ